MGGMIRGYNTRRGQRSAVTANTVFVLVTPRVGDLGVAVMGAGGAGPCSLFTAAACTVLSP